MKGGVEPSLALSGERKPRLSRKLKAGASMLDVVMLGAGAAIGPSIFSVLGPTAKMAGSGMPVSIVLAAVPMGILGLVYSFLASAAPRSGASYEWPREFIHPTFAFLISWMRIIGSIGVLVTTALVLTYYAGIPAAFPVKLAMFLVFLLAYLINVAGIGVAAKAQTFLMGILLFVLAVYVLCGIGGARPALVDPIPSSLFIALLPLPLLVNMFMGIETATEVGEEIRRPERTIPIGIGTALLLTLIVYLCVAGMTFALLGEKAVAASTAPLLDASHATGYAFLPTLVTVGATLALFKSVNVNFMIFTRFLFAMGRSGALPSIVGRVHAKRGTPHIACTIAFLLTCLGLLMPANLTFLLIASGIPTLLKYCSTSICAFRLPGGFPDVYARAALRFRPGAVRILGLLGATCAIAIVALGVETDWRPLSVTGAWLLLGALYLRWRNAAQRA